MYLHDLIAFFDMAKCFHFLYTLKNLRAFKYVIYIKAQMRYFHPF